MTDPIEEIIDNRNPPLCVSHAKTVRDALFLMIENDFSQLPITDDDGFLIGVISEKAISRQYYHLNEKENVSLLDLTVDHCQEKPVTLERGDAGLFEVLELLKNTYAVIITSEKKPTGIITDYDAVLFFRDWSEGLMRVQNIELALRQYIEAIFPNDKSQEGAVNRVFGMNRNDHSKPNKVYEALGLHDHVQLIESKYYWERFEPFLKPKKVFTNWMSPVIQSRNQLAHFRGRIDEIQLDGLIRAESWIASRPKIDKGTIKTQPVREIDTHKSQSPGKYGPIQDWLESQSGYVSSGNEIQVSFNELESIIGESFPDSARKRREWWANDFTSPKRQSFSWLKAGWRVENVDLALETVIFKRTDEVLQKLFLVELIQELKSIRPGITRTTKAQSGWIDFGAGRTGFLFAWAFGKGNLRTELYIDTEDKQTNKKAFNLLQQHKKEIESEIGQEVDWQLLESKRASRISVNHPGNAKMSEKELSELKKWAIDTMLKFVDAFQYRIRELELE